jgi:hypothetical protein
LRGHANTFIRTAWSEPEAIAAMSEAFEAACNELLCTDHGAAMREVIAGRIVAAARFGERDPVRLRAAALVGPAGKRG